MPSLEIRGIDNVLHAVGDLDQARDFYGGRLGLALKFEMPEVGIALYEIAPGGAGLLVRRQAPSPPRVWLRVVDARAAAAMLGAGAREINTGWVVEVADPWGNVVGLTDYVKRPDLAGT